MSDERDVSRRYRELPREEPPRALDDAIVAAARKAVRSRHRWQVSLAAAAVLTLVVALTVQLQREEPDVAMVAPQAQVPEAPSPSPPAPDASVREQSRMEAPKKPAARPPVGPAPPERAADSAGTS